MNPNPLHIHQQMDLSLGISNANVNLTIATVESNHTTQCRSYYHCTKVSRKINPLKNVTLMYMKRICHANVQYANNVTTLHTISTEPLFRMRNH